MAMRILKPLVRWGGYYPSKQYTPLVYPGGYTTMSAAIGPLDPLNTFSGDIVRFTTKRGLPMQSLKVNMSPVQDLHGYDNPWPAGGGKNKFEPFGGSSGGITFTLQDDGTILISGTSTSTAWKSIQTDYYPLPYNGINAGDTVTIWSDVYFEVRIYDGAKAALTSKSSYNSNPSTFTIPSDAAFFRFIESANNDSIPQGETVNKIQKCFLGTAYSAWTPYSNICPINGWTRVSVWDTGKNLYNPSETEQNKWVGETGEASANGFWLSGYILLKAGMTYYRPLTGSVRNAYYSLNKEFKAYFAASGAITPQEDCYIRFVGVEASYPADGEIQFELGSTETEYEPYKGNSYSVTFEETVYGATPDIVSGEMPVTMGMVDMGSLNYSYIDYLGYPCFVSVNKPTGIITEDWSLKQGIICSMYPTGGKVITQPSADKAMTRVTDGRIFVRDFDYTDVTTFKAAVTGQKIVYELATPIPTTTTPTPITALFGYNNVWSNAGPVEVVAYGTPIEEPDVEPLGALGLLLGGAYRNDHTPDDVSDEEALDILLGGADR